MKALFVAMALSVAAAIPAQAVTVISVGDFDNAFTGDFSAMAPGTILGGEAPDVDPLFTALGFSEVTAFGTDSGTNPFSSSIVGLGASDANEPMIVGPANPESLVQLFISLSSQMTRFAFAMEASEFTDVFTVAFTLGGSVVDSIDIDTSGGLAPILLTRALEANTAFDGVRFTGLDKAVFESFTVEAPSEVPLPAGLPLLLAGLGGLAAIRRFGRKG